MFAIIWKGFYLPDSHNEEIIKEKNGIAMFYIN
jgi:hypothetical protein